jgi:thiamine-phosphate pyrophosphorylase
MQHREGNRVKLVLISPESDLPREAEWVAAMLGSGLERYHLRKPGWSRTRHQEWLQAFAPHLRRRIVLHDHHDLVATLELSGRHWRDGPTAPVDFPDRRGLTSRSCHDLKQVKAAMGSFDAVFLSPIFASLSKPDYRPETEVYSGLSELLSQRSQDARKTEVLALGGITAQRIELCREWGFDGVAVVGAVWQAEHPLHAFENLQSVVLRYAA